MNLRQIVYELSGNFSCIDLRVVDRCVLYNLLPRPAPRTPQLLSPYLSRHHSISLHPDRVGVSSFCGLHDEHQATHRPVHLALAAAGIVFYTASISIGTS